jgi:hypothetical protein
MARKKAPDGYEPITGPFTTVNEATGRITSGDITFRLTESGRFLVDSLTIRADDGEGIEPADLKALVPLIDDGMRLLLEHAIGPEGADAGWRRHVEARVPRRDGEPKPEWIARVWREYYEPTGRTLRALADDLGLAYKSARTYASTFDPSKVSK